MLGGWGNDTITGGDRGDSRPQVGLTGLRETGLAYTPFI